MCSCSLSDLLRKTDECAWTFIFSALPIPNADAMRSTQFVAANRASVVSGVPSTQDVPGGWDHGFDRQYLYERPLTVCMLHEATWPCSSIRETCAEPSSEVTLTLSPFLVTYSLFLISCFLTAASRLLVPGHLVSLLLVRVTSHVTALFYTLSHNYLYCTIITQNMNPAYHAIDSQKLECTHTCMRKRTPILENSCFLLFYFVCQ